MEVGKDSFMKRLLLYISCIVVSSHCYAQDDRMTIDLDTKFKTLPKELTDPQEVRSTPSQASEEISSSLPENTRFSKEARCFRVRNIAEYTVLGDVSTDFEDMPDGARIRHKSAFRLAPSKSREFCSRGPFFEGGKVELTLKTLVPIFSCKTKIDKEIIIIGRKKIDGDYDTRALCHR